MDTILVPTDFSEIAANAASYAAEIAKAAKAKIILFHAWHVPAVQPETYSAIPHIDAMEEMVKNNLVKLRAHLHTRYGPHIKIDIAYSCGFAEEEISLFIQHTRVNLIVMGMRGAGWLGEKLMGSVTTSVIRMGLCPVLAVNRGVQFNGIKKIVFAYDYAALENSQVIAPLKTFGRTFNAHIYVLNVNKPELDNEIPETPQAIAGIRMDHLLEEISHSFHFTCSTGVAKGINEFIAEKQADLLVMIPHKQSALGRIFNGSDTTHMAFNLQVPLLAMPG